MTPIFRPERLIAIALLAGAVTGTGAQALVGPPTYEATASLDLVPGDRPPITAYVVEIRWRSEGHPESRGSAMAGPFVNFPPSEAQAIANDTELKALAYTGGTVQWDPVQVPHLHATATAGNTRFWQTGAVDTPLDFMPFLDGALAAELVFAEIPSQLSSKVTFSLDVLNPAGDAVLQVFRNTARIDWNIGRSRWDFAAASTLPGPDWVDAFSTTATPSPRPTMRSELAYLDFIANAYTAPAGSLFGLRWTLQAETLVEGIAVQGAMTADFLHTAGIGFAVADGAPPGAMLTEVLTLPPVPEPTPAALWLAGLALLAWRTGWTRSVR